MGGADAEQFSLGAEDVHYEGPLQIRLQVRAQDNGVCGGGGGGGVKYNFKD